uniref:hypothetical protein n=1 Tax=Burkholderia sp. M701 TaxID=326454 RepID=UPI00159EC52A|nr:hypothetical protein [Burkholderia sp. M701]
MASTTVVTVAQHAKAHGMSHSAARRSLEKMVKDGVATKAMQHGLSSRTSHSGKSVVVPIRVNWYTITLSP